MKKRRVLKKEIKEGLQNAAIIISIIIVILSLCNIIGTINEEALTSCTEYGNSLNYCKSVVYGK